jgi:hypothetical protein
MLFEQLKDIRNDILNDSKDSNGFIKQSLVIQDIMPLLLETKVVDSEEVTFCYYVLSGVKILNSYTINESGERLQLFVVNDNYLDDKDDDFNISLRNDYDNEFKKVIKFINSAFKGDLNDIQDSHPIKPLLSFLTSIEGFEQIDVIDIFLISLSATVSFRGNEPQLRDIHFKDISKDYICNLNGQKYDKNLLIIRRVIDLNYLANIKASKGRGQPLKVIFKDVVGKNIEVIKVAEEREFESYLCVLDACILADLYKRYSKQLLEKNIRSFLQFKGVNRGIKQTIKEEPEKFIAFNNGLTITATDAKVSIYKRTLFLESLEDFQIVNGGQTTASIYFSQKEGLDISKVKVMAKINVARNNKANELEDLISKISEYSNSQSRVSKVDLRSRNPKLIKLKSLSESVRTPSGKEWFFERAKGDFNTQARKHDNPSSFKSRFLPDVRFTKELLAKYYCAWGEIPFLVKKGGEKIFRLFIESLDPEDSVGIDIDRDFYEDLIARVILFRAMEKIYGQGKNSMGQLRSATIPYSLSVLYTFTDGSDESNHFNLSQIWKDECIKENLKLFLIELLSVVNNCIKKYSLSEDYGEYSKKQELWDRIKTCKEITSLMSSDNSKIVLNKYTK